LTCAKVLKGEIEVMKLANSVRPSRDRVIGEAAGTAMAA